MGQTAPIDIEPDPQITIATTREACVGSAASYLMRTIALHAGQLGPGIHEALFYQLHRPFFGETLDKVQSWFEDTMSELHRVGYRVGGRRVAFPTESLCTWVAAGNGYRGAVLETNGATLRPELDIRGIHAVALTVPVDAGASELMMVDPWPSNETSRRPPPTLEAAHRDRRYGAIVFYWSGWS